MHKQQSSRSPVSAHMLKRSRETTDTPLFEYKPWHTDTVARCFKPTCLDSFLLWLLDSWCGLPEFLQLARVSRALHVHVNILWQTLIDKDIRKLALHVDEARAQPWRALLGVTHLSRARRCFNVCERNAWALIQFNLGMHANKRALVYTQPDVPGCVTIEAVRSCHTLEVKPCEFLHVRVRVHAQQLVSADRKVIGCILSAIYAAAVPRDLRLMETGGHL